MSENLPHILIVEDDEIFLHKYTTDLTYEEDTYQIATARSLGEARVALANRSFAVVLADIKLKAASRGGLELLKEIKASHSDTQVIIFTGIGGTDDAREAEEYFADGYLTKPLETKRLRQVTRNAVLIYFDRQRIRENMRAPGANRLPTPERLVYYCRPMSISVNKASQIADNSNNVLIVGEPGTGKGLFAEGIHFGSSRESLELVNCSSLSERTIERLLFGSFDETTQIYVAGILERLQNGTLVLDNVNRLSLRLQGMLLNALNNHSYQIHPDIPAYSIAVRVIGINEADLLQDVAQGFFLKELCTLIAQEQIDVPPLRERFDEEYNDIVPLATHFARKYATESNITISDGQIFAPETEHMLRQYWYPRNVGELESIMRIAVSKSRGRAIEPHHLPERMHQYGIRVGLATQISSANIVVKCPHGPFSCNQTQLIIDTRKRLRGIYLHMPSEELVTLSQFLNSIGMTPLMAKAPPQARIKLCSICVQVQSARMAIINLNNVDFYVSYVVGLLHSLGIPTFLYRKAVITEQNLDFENIWEYDNATEISGRLQGWISELI